jgi:hypothetical protein
MPNDRERRRRDTISTSPARPALRLAPAFCRQPSPPQSQHCQNHPTPEATAHHAKPPTYATKQTPYVDNRLNGQRSTPPTMHETRPNHDEPNKVHPETRQNRPSRKRNGPGKRRGQAQQLPYFQREERVAGWVARTRPLAEPLSPRGPQPVPRTLRALTPPLNGPPDSFVPVPGL